MIIDVTLDRKDGAIDYSPAKHLKAIYDYATDARMSDISAVKTLPFPADDIFRGTGDGTREYTALFTL